MSTLVITRKTDQRVLLAVPGRANPIELRITRCKFDRVRLAIEADSDIVIDRADCNGNIEARPNRPTPAKAQEIQRFWRDRRKQTVEDAVA